MKLYIKSSDDSYDGRYEVVTISSGAMRTPPTEYDVISSYLVESKPKSYASYKAALKQLMKFKGMVKESVHGGYYGSIPCIRTEFGEDVVAYMDYDGNLVEM